MADSQKENKKGLIFTPSSLSDKKDFFRCIHISRKDKLVSYNVVDLTEQEIRKTFVDLPNQVKDAVYSLSNAGLVKAEDEIIKKHRAQKSGVPLIQFLRSAYIRQLLQRFETLKPFFSLVKFYQRITNPATGNQMVVACSFSNHKPLLQFEVTQTGSALQLQTIVSINANQYNLTEFNRFHFLLESRNEYFVLSYKDYQTIEWLLQNNPDQYKNDATLFAQNILSKLEEDYEVNRNNLFEVTTIDVPPIHRVLLSEISNSFLVFTPQWVYDGYVAEGAYRPSFETSNNGEAFVVKRDKEAETFFKKQLEALHVNFPNQLNGYYHISFAEAQKKQWFLKVYHQLLEMNIELVGIDMLTHFRYSAHKPTTHIEIIKKETNILIVHFSLQFGNETVPLTELQKILIAGQRAVMLKDGSLGVLTETWLSEYGIMLKHGKINKKELHVPQWLALTDQQKDSGNKELKVSVNENWWQQWQTWQQPDKILYPVSNKIQAALRPYQQKGFEWMKLLAEVGAGACLADDMGLGKTLQTICFIADRLEQNPNGIALIVCPSSLIYNWHQEVKKFAPHLRTYVHHGSQRNMDNIVAAKTDICITSYGTLRSDITQLSEIVFDVVVIDESHNIKNPAAHITRAVNQLQTSARIALSGTPVMNNTFDLYSQLEFLLPGMFGSREFFKREYADAIDRDRNEEKIMMLQKLTAPFILRRTKEQVAKDLPEKTESILWCNMSVAQKNMYDDIKNNIKSNLFLNIAADGLGKSKLAVLQGIMKLKQVCSSPLLLPAEEQTTDLSVKTTMLMDEISNLGDHKVLVFSQFSKMLHLLADSLTKQGISFYLLEGSTTAAKRAEIVASFQADGNTTKVFLISLMAGNTGLTLTAADYVFLFDPWWNNAVQQQAIDRTHRIGQTKNVFAYKMICKDTIEEKIVQLQQNKKALSDNLIGDNEGFVKQLTKEDVDFLFS